MIQISICSRIFDYKKAGDALLLCLIEYNLSQEYKLDETAGSRTRDERSSDQDIHPRGCW